MSTRFTGVCLISTDVPALAAFYAAVRDGQWSGDDVFATVSGPGAALSIFSVAGMERMAPGSTTGAGSGSLTLELEVDDVDRCHERLLALAVPIVKPPTTQPWGRRSVWIRDPEGNLVNLYRTVPAPADPADIVAEYFHALLTERDLSVCDRLLAEDYRDHDATADTAPGPRATREYVAGLLDAYPDLRCDVDQIVALDQYVAVRARWLGTHRRTGEPLRQTGLVLLRLTPSGQFAERRSTYTRLPGSDAETGRTPGTDTPLGSTS